MAYLEACRLKDLSPLADLDDVVLARLADASCRAVENYCNRRFESQTYDEMYQATKSRSLYLHQKPITAVQAVRVGQQIALQVVNTTQYVQAATVQVTDTGLTLSFTNNATTTATPLTWEDYPTVGELADAITALGNGWQATTSTAFTSWASADLAVYKATQSARTVTATLAPHYHYLSGYRLDLDKGELVLGSGWWGGYQSIRVQYTAGYEVIPEDLIQATAELASATYQAGKSDPNLVSESLGGYSYTRATTKGLADLSVLARQTLNLYRRLTVPYFKAGW